MQNQRFAGKVAIVTGSSSGIGQATAVLLAKQGASVVINGLVADDCEKTLKLITNLGINEDKCLLVPGDVTDPLMTQRIVDETVVKFGKIDVVANCAGVYSKPGDQSDTEEIFDFIFDVNVKSIMRLNKLALPYLEKTKGTIVNISSNTSMHRVDMIHAPYAMSKASLDHYICYEAPGLAKKGIRMNNVNPGMTISNFFGCVGKSEKDYEEMSIELAKGTIPLGRAGRPDEIANCISFLASDEASYVTGATLVVDGGAMHGVKGECELPNAT
ncbi:hypothetical protein L596_026800 [Steinernema carpocapsae]|uniref:Uncharacterized protein n=1 Tax=Steinernema carpocapsae TaxID=34508 RepID=A0A4U5M2E8_STECR|nr:hypothetical protein L596_026800 [Steinernema carpocapsae]